MFHHVSFDIGGVASASNREAIVAKGAERWPDFTYSDFKRMFVPQWKGMEKDYWCLFQNGLIGADEYLSASMRAGKFPDTEENKQHFRAVLKLFTNWYQPVLDLAADLKQRGYHTSVLTNNHELLFREDGLVAIVDVVVSSHHIHVSKPDAQAYKTLLERIGSPNPADVLFTDDKEKNVKGAEQAGIQGYHFRSKELPMDEAFTEFVRHLKQVGLDVHEPCAYFQKAL